MKLTTIKEIYRNQEKYLNQEITIGGWVRSVRDSKTFGFMVVHDGSFLEHYRWFTMIRWRISLRFQLNVGATGYCKGNFGSYAACKTAI